MPHPAVVSSLTHKPPPLIALRCFPAPHFAPACLGTTPLPHACGSPREGGRFCLMPCSPCAGRRAEPAPDPVCHAPCGSSRPCAASRRAPAPERQRSARTSAHSARVVDSEPAPCPYSPGHTSPRRHSDKAATARLLPPSAVLLSRTI